MTGYRWRTSLLVLALVLSVPLSASHAGKNIYLYDPSVTSEIDLNAYLLDGTVKKPTGGSFAHYVQKGPAPASYPTIDVSAQSFEHLGASNAQIDGVLRQPRHYMPNRGNRPGPSHSCVMAGPRIPERPHPFTLDRLNQTTLETKRADDHKSFNVGRFPTREKIVISCDHSSCNIMSKFLSAQAKYGNSKRTSPFVRDQGYDTRTSARTAIGSSSIRRLSCRLLRPATLHREQKGNSHASIQQFCARLFRWRVSPDCPVCAERQLGPGFPD
jgi:hypothetical protein